jgi:hypothetical protein
MTFESKKSVEKSPQEPHMGRRLFVLSTLASVAAPQVLAQTTKEAILAAIAESLSSLPSGSQLEAHALRHPEVRADI